MHYLLFYEVGEDYVAKRAQFRDAHLKKAWEASDRGELVLGGALAGPVDGAVLLFRGESPAVAERFAAADPYVTSGLVKRWRVREWTTVAGEDAAKPVRAGEEVEPKAESGAPVLRMWRARCGEDGFGRYERHVTEKVFPLLRAIEGYRGAYLLRRAVNGAFEVMVLTLWQSMAAVQRFAGADVEKAVVEPEVKAALISFDEVVEHFEVVKGPKG